MPSTERGRAFYGRFVIGNLIVDAFTAFWVMAGWSPPGTWVMTIDRNFGVMGRVSSWSDRSLLLSAMLLLVAIGVYIGRTTPYVVARAVQGVFFCYLGIIAFRVHSTGTIYVIIGLAAWALAYRTVQRRLASVSEAQRGLDRAAAIQTVRHDEFMANTLREEAVSEERHQETMGELRGIHDEAAGAHAEAKEITRSMGNEGWRETGGH